MRPIAYMTRFEGKLACWPRRPISDDLGGSAAPRAGDYRDALHRRRSRHPQRGQGPAPSKRSAVLAGRSLSKYPPALPGDIYITKPLFLPVVRILKMQESGLSESMKQALFEGNARRFLAQAAS